MKRITILLTGLLSLTWSCSFAQYCTASGGCAEFISNVTLETINQSSGCDNYMYFDGTPANLIPGESYEISVTLGNPYGGDIVGVWIDWDQDMDFNNDGMISLVTNPFPTYTGSILVPVGALSGQTRMRVRMQWRGTLEPCGTTGYGEVEDYNVYIGAPQDPPEISVSPLSIMTIIEGNDSTRHETFQITNNGEATLNWAAFSDCSVPGAMGYALRFNGMQQYVDVVHGFGNFTTMTIEFWRRSEGMGTGCCPRMLTIWKDGENNGHDDGLLFEHWGEDQNTVSIWFSPDGNNTEVAAFDVPQQEWHHIAFTFDGTDALTYLDGLPVGSTSFPPGFVNTFNLLQFGGDAFIDGSGRYFNGSLDEIRIWNVARSITEIQQSMGIQLTGSEPGLVAYFQLNEGMGNVAGDLTGNVPDGNLVNGPVWITPGALGITLLEIDPPGGSIPGGGSAIVDLNFSSYDTPFGIYYCDLTISSNDPDQPMTIIPVQIEIRYPLEIPLSHWAVILAAGLIGLLSVYFLFRRSG